ncbi:beta-ketoacyl-[acyl-carrier-protein] synthase family protein, partial [Streptomyces sp. T-3]|nr:beta-ketoacyl-[acyl-carrier-protein] synthase family protein [Streptomyces sp. T-3]
IARALGPAPRTVGSCVKPAIGHLGAAAGALNAAVCAMALETGAVPPTLNLADPDPQCRALDWVPGRSRELPLRHTVSLARGMEGQQTALVLSTPISDRRTQ